MAIYSHSNGISHLRGEYRRDVMHTDILYCLSLCHPFEIALIHPQLLLNYVATAGMEHERCTLQSKPEFRLRSDTYLIQSIPRRNCLQNLQLYQKRSITEHW